MKPNPIPVIAVLLLLCVQSGAQNSPSQREEVKYQLKFRNQTILPEKNIEAEIISRFNNKLSRSNGKSLAVIQFEHIPSLAEREVLRQQGIELLEYIPNFAYTVSLTGSLDVTGLKNVKARAILELIPELKTEAALFKGNIPSWAVKIPGTVDCWISFPKTFTYNEVSDELRRMNFDLLPSPYKNYRIISVRIAANRIEELASLSCIDYVQLAPKPDAAMNDRSESNARANILTSSLPGGRNLTGQGVTIGVGDNSDPLRHIDFTDRIINRAGIFAGSHGIHVIGTAAGAGIIKERFTGFAPKSTVIAQVFSGIITNAPAYVQDHGMVITNNSYGDVTDDCLNFGYYDLHARVLDKQTNDLPNLLHIFSAGNSGQMGCGIYVPGFGTVLSGYQSAKNVITVGATNAYDVVAPFSSRGPVQDGRIKPEIMAHGDTVWSDWPVHTFSTNRGTSMASPAISGGLALLYEQYKALHSGVNPKNALMKAILLNGATDLGNPGPDYTYGFGRMNLLRSVQMIEANAWFTGTVGLAATQTHSIPIPASPAIHQLKIMLYWNDSAASVLAKPTLVNDLDLEVRDPSNNPIFPQKLDTTAANIQNFATTGVDHLNNIEQVVINNPVPGGTYTVRVTGTTIPSAIAQEYFVVYDTLPVSTKLTYPIGGEKFLPLDSVNINWDSWGGTAGTFTVDYFNGSSWSTLGNVSSTSRQLKWYLNATDTTDQARIRVTNNGTGSISTSAPFVILGPDTISLATNQCESYIGIKWTKAAKATDYEVMMLRNGEMVSVGTTTDTNYVISGLSKDTTYWVSVRPRLNGNPGLRAMAVTRQPNNGSCTGSISDNDIKIDSIRTPAVSGRKFTSTEFSSAVPLTVRVKNLDDVASSSMLTFSYTINGGSPVIESITPTIAGLDTLSFTFTTTMNLSAVGSYNIVVTVAKSGDPVTSNNTASRFVKQLDNPPITGIIPATPFIDDMEAAPVQTLTTKTAGLNGLDRYDFVNSTINGQLRSFVNTGIAYSGTKALTLDINCTLGLPGNTDSLTGTFNLGTYAVANNDLRLDFRYKNHGQLTNPANRVWIRGDDMKPWIQVYDLFANQNPANGTYKFTGSIEISDSLTKYVQDFSSSFQVRWGQWGVMLAADDESGMGYTIDDVRLYEVADDIQIVTIDSPIVNSCNLSANTRVRISIRNNSNSTVTNVPVNFNVDGLGWLASDEIIPSIAANTTISYLFTATANLATPGTHRVYVRTTYGTDTYHENDTLSVFVYNQPLITSYPYLENFESGTGNWYASGVKSTWEYGTPTSTKIFRAASGSKAWKTALAGGYRDAEFSYLYSPCFNISGMTQPTLSLSIALDLEDCGSGFCDGAYVEYSTDGTTWTRLGASGQGTNWYNKSYAGNNLWSVQDYTRWHVATIPLPTGISNLRLRFVMRSDPALAKEGIAIDDIHIYDNLYGIYTGTGASPVINQAAVNGTSWIDFIEPGTNKLIASINPDGQNLGSTDVQSYVYIGAVRYNLPSNQYYHSRNITIKPTTVNLPDSATVRFYFLDQETENLLNATGCGTCYKPRMAYELGVSKYSDPIDTYENGTLSDDNQGTWLFINSNKAVKVPFDKGYYAEFRVKDFSEFWLNNGGFNNNTPLPLQLISFTATKKPNRDVLVEWITASENNVDRFEIELAKGNDDYRQNRFIRIGTVASQGNSTQQQFYSFNDAEANKSGVRYYRLKIIDLDGTIHYSAVRPVVFNDDIQWQVYPNPSAGIFNLVYQSPDGQLVTVKIYDVNGRVVKQEQMIATGFMQKLTIDMQQKQVATGLYMMEVVAGDKKQFFKLVKQ